MDRSKELDQWWEGLGEAEQRQFRARGQLTAEQRASLVRAGLLDRGKPDAEGDVVAQLKMRH